MMGGVMMRRQCPLCEWFMDEPPPEFDTGDLSGGTMTVRVRQHSALPALAAHVVGRHPDSALAGEIRAYAAAHRSTAPVVEAPTLNGVVGNLVRAARAAEDDAAVARVAEAIWLHGGGQ